MAAMNDPPILPHRPLQYYGPRGRLLGRGAYGAVYQYGCVAIKEFHKRNDQDENQFVEITLMVRLCHPHLMHALDVVETQDGGLGIVMELATLGTLEDQIVTLDTDERITIAHQVGSALSYLHRLNIIHRDIKPSNVLLYRDLTARLADFSNAAIPHKMMQDGWQYIHDYRPPEVFMYQGYDKKADVWAFGSLLHFCFSGHSVIEGNNDYEAVLDLFTRFGASPSRLRDNYIAQLKTVGSDATNHIVQHLENAITIDRPSYHYLITNPLLIDLLDHIFQYDPTRRPKMEEAITHSFFGERSPIISSHRINNSLAKATPLLSPRVVEWVVRAVKAVHLRTRTIQATVRLLDQLATQISLTPGDELEWAAAALYTASIFSDTDPSAVIRKIVSRGQIVEKQRTLLRLINYNTLFNLPDDYRIRQILEGKRDGNAYLLLALYLTPLRFEMDSAQLYDLHLRIERTELVGEEQRRLIELFHCEEILSSSLTLINSSSLQTMPDRPTPGQLIEKIVG